MSGSFSTIRHFTASLHMVLSMEGMVKYTMTVAGH